MAEKIDVGVTIKGTEKVSTDLNKIDSKTQDISGSVDKASGSLDRMTGGMVTMFKGIAGGVKKAVLGMKTLRGAMMATGIGALVVLVGSLVAFFTKTQKGAELLEIASASLGVVMGKLTDTLSTMGGIMVSIFTDPVQAIKDFGGFLKTFVMDRVTNLMDGLGFLGSAVSKLFKRDFSGAMADAKKGVENLAMANPLIAGTVLVVGELVDATKGLVSETTKAVKAQNELTKASQELRQAERDLIVTEAEKLAIIAEQEVISRDITKSFAERKAANKLAQETEESLHAQRLANAEEKLRIHREEMALTESLEEDYQREAELEAAAINLRTQSAKLKKKFTMEEGLLNEQEAAENKAIDDAELLRIATLRAATQSAQQNEVDALELKYIKLNEMAQGNAEIEKELKEKQEADLLAITKKYAEEEVVVIDTAAEEKKAIEQATADAVKAARLGIVAAGFDALKSMAKTEEGQKRLAISQILVNQGIAMSEAFRGAQQAAAATGPAAPVMSPLFTAQMIGMVLSSFASIKGVMNQAGASAGSVGTSSGGGSSAGMQLGLTPNLEGVTQVEQAIPPVKAFVVQSQLADESALVAQLKAMASL
tara:strand:- start:1361 stop:3151 length:1791 start_codon:yes stop_codon:yes gene_type:complete